MNKEELNELVESINRNMNNYNKDITLRMNISDNLEREKLKQSAEELCEELTEYSHEFSQGETLDLIEGSKNQKKMGLRVRNY